MPLLHPKLNSVPSRLQAVLTPLTKLLLFFIVLSVSEFTCALQETFPTTRQLSFTLNNKLDPENEVVKSSSQEPLNFDDESKEKEEGYFEEMLKRQLMMPTVLMNNIMIPINLEKGQLFSFMFSNDSLWSNKSPITSSDPSKLELFSNHKTGSIPGSLKKESKDLLFQDKPLAQDALIITAQEMKKTKEKSSKVFEKSSKKTIYISVTTCLQPKAVSNSVVTPPPQLQLYISRSQSNQFPGPARAENPNPAQNQEIVNLVGGYALHTIEMTGDIYLGVYAINDPNFVGIYSAQVAASIDAPYHYHANNSESNLFVADSDTDSVLLYTEPLIHDGANSTLLRELASSPPQFVIFMAETTITKNIMGLENSYCGLEQNFNVVTPNLLTTSIKSNFATNITTLGQSNLPRQQFFIDELKPGTKYAATLAIAGHPQKSNLVGGGGRVFGSLTFNTLAADNCDLIHSLSFCDQVAYSVPSNPKKFPNSSSLAAFYDNSTQAIFKNFEKVLAQIPCEINPSGQYSLARTCDDCTRAYKTWLCAVNIPRCTDILSPMAWLQPRAVDQAFPNGSYLSTSFVQGRNTTADRFSRNVNIDEFISPGPYKEILPCQELCHSLVSSCPASLGFNCPRPGQIGFHTSYGQMPLKDINNQGRNVNVTCNFPGLVYFSMAYHQRPWLPLTQLVLAITISMMSWL